MTCEKVRLPDGSVYLLCGPRRRRRPPPRCAVCKEKPAEYECDGRPASGARESCDKPMCKGCIAFSKPDPNNLNGTLDYCPAHAEQGRSVLELPLFRPRARGGT